MIQLETIRQLSKYGDWANRLLLGAAAPLSDALLDQPFEMGPGSLRRTLIHIYNGEHVWLSRWQRTDIGWPPEVEAVSVAELGERFSVTQCDRDEFLEKCREEELAKMQRYWDSKGGLYFATLGDMLFQGVNHSTHHRAQAVNMLRRLGAGVVELDYMMWLRKPAQV